MPVRLVEGQKPYTGGTGIEIDTDKVISLLLREENNLIMVNDDNEIYTDLQLADGIAPTDTFPVGVTVGKVLEADGWTQSGLLLNRKTTSGDYARWIYGADGNIYFDGGTGVWNQVYYSSQVDALLQALQNYIDQNYQPKLTAGAGIVIDQNNVISAQGAGTGDVSGPNSSVDGHLAVFDGTTGKAIKDGGALPSVIDNLTSTSTTDALSANQGKVLNQKIEDLMGMGKFLSLWNCATGQPISFPLSTPYAYTTGDYFIVSVVSTANPPVNYKPNGSSYTGTASTTTTQDEVEEGDFYVYDGNVWLFASNHGKTVTFANIAGQPSDNTNLATALNAKQDTLTAGTGISISANNEISNTIPGATVSASAPATPTEGMQWYDTTNDVLKTYDGTNWNVVGDDGANINTKTFYLSSTSDTTTAQAAYDWYVAGKNPIVVLSNIAYILGDTPTSTGINFYSHYKHDVGNSDTTLSVDYVKFTLSSGTVTSVTKYTGEQVRVLATNVTGYITPYTPTSDGHPATKKYVDDNKGDTIEYVTQAEYTALLPGAESDGKHYFIYSEGTVAVTGVTLDESTISLTTVGDTYQLTATISPNDATDKSVTWSSSDQSVATVSNTGLVTCVTPGTCTITVTTTDGSFTDTCDVDAGGWTPGADTLLYYDFEHTTGTTEANQASSSSYDGTYTATPTIGTLSSGKKYFDNGGTTYLATDNTLSGLNYGNLTVCVWIKPQANTGAWFGQDWRGHSGATIYCYSDSSQTSYYLGSYISDYGTTKIPQDTWNNVVITGSGTTQTVYLNGVSIGTRTMNASSANKTFYVGAIGIGGGSPSASTTGNVSFGSVILENKAWTSQEVSDYFDLTKGDYGIS